MGIILTEQQCQEILNEMYIGQTDDILELEKLISKARSKYSGGNTAKNIAATQSDEDLNKIADKIEEIWGFGSVAFYVYQSNIPNASTYPVTCSIDIKPENMIVKGKNGYKYSKKSNYCSLIQMASCVFLDTEKYSDKEIMAILLHEIGHSFDACNHETIKMVQNARAGKIMILIMSLIKDLMLAPSTGGASILSSIASISLVAVYNTNLMKHIDAKAIRKSLEKNDIFNKISTLLDVYGKSIKDSIFSFIEFIQRATGFKAIMDFLYTPFAWAGNKINKLLQTKTSGITQGRVKEYLADSFPMMYGYASYQASALEKMCYNTNSKNDEIINKIPLIGKLDQMSNYNLFVLAETFSTHPSLAARTNNMTKELEGELKKSNLPPKMKKQIEANLKDLKEFRDKVRDESKIAHDDPKRYRKAWLAVAMALDDDSTRVTKFEKDYVDMETRDEYYDKLIEEQNRVSLDNLELI